jgi:hypothetical protein
MVGISWMEEKPVLESKRKKKKAVGRVGILYIQVHYPYCHIVLLVLDHPRIGGREQIMRNKKGDEDVIPLPYHGLWAYGYPSVRKIGSAR